MIVNLFRHTQAISVLSILMLSILIWMGFSFQENPEIVGPISPFFDSILSPILQQPIINRLIAGALVFWQCILVNRIMVRQKVFSTNTFFPGLFYFLALSISPEATYLSPSLLALTFIVLSLNKILDSYLDKTAYSKVFDSSILMSLALLIHPPFIIFAALIWIGISIFSQVEWRHWVLSILGLGCPWLILYSISQYYSIEELKLSYFFHFLIEESPAFILDRGALLSLFGFGLITLLALTELVVSLKRKNIKARKSYILLLWILALTLIYTFLSPDNFSIKLLAFALPSSAIISNYFYYNKNTKWLNFISVCLIIILFLNHFIW
jgi:hypothetical protein